jgi:Histidine kinase-, DNA gyrase B-, and HSP90-like ATPase
MLANTTLEDALKDKEAEYIPLEVSSGILLHIGAGIYNSVAGAVKELVSNAYDADATRVTIMTSYPDFDRIVVVDNGLGMTEATFAKAMSSIGSSLKREIANNGLTPRYKRPIIGHLGIGLMALSQICDTALVESQAAGAETRFVAKLDFTAIRRKSREQVLASTLAILQERGKKADIQRAKDDLETLAELSMARDAAAIATRQEPGRQSREHLGYCIIYPGLPATPGGQGTKITLHPLDPAVMSTFKDLNRDVDALPKRLLTDEILAKNPKVEGETKRPRRFVSNEGALRLWQEWRDQVNRQDWQALCETLSDGAIGYEELPQYHQFLWELALLSPIQYFPSGPATIKPVLVQERQSLAAYKFSVIVDNRKLLKPIILPSAKIRRLPVKELQEGLDYIVDTFEHSTKVPTTQGESDLSFSGYIFWQRSQIQPSSVRGIEIYIRNVGIGQYDHTLLNFSKVNPTSRAGQISSEIYVASGLEDALNVDRNSFRETDAEYIALRDFIWRLLGSAARTDGILGRSVDSYWKRKAIKNQGEERIHRGELRELVKNLSDETVSITLSNAEGDQPFQQVGKHKLIVYLNSAAWPKSSIERRRAQRLLIPLKAAAMSGATTDKLLSLLAQLLK